MTDLEYEKVWPSDQIRDNEQEQFAQRGEVLLSYAVEIGDIIHMCDAADVDFEEVSFEIVQSTTGLAVLVKSQQE